MHDWFPKAHTQFLFYDDADIALDNDRMQSWKNSSFLFNRICEQNINKMYIEIIEWSSKTVIQLMTITR